MISIHKPCLVYLHLFLLVILHPFSVCSIFYNADDLFRIIWRKNPVALAIIMYGLDKTSLTGRSIK